MTTSPLDRSSAFSSTTRDTVLLSSLKMRNAGNAIGTGMIPEVGGRRSEDGGQRSEVGGWRLEAEVRGRRSVRGQKRADLRPLTSLARDRARSRIGNPGGKG